MDYSAIIVLGNLMSKEGVLNGESSSRMDVAINAFRENQAPCIITCGWAYREDSPITIADAMKKYAIETGGIPSDAVVAEKNSRDTVGDAVFTKRNIVLRQEWDKILVATSDYHVARTCEIFAHVYGRRYTIKVIGANTDGAERRQESERKSTEAFRETFKETEAGNDAAIYKRLCEGHPFYNGQIYPKLADEKAL